MTTPAQLRIDFVSDVVCPWCVIGLKSLEQALVNLAGEVTADWHFHPFELNPGMAPEGENSAEHIARKYGRPPEAGAAAREQIKAMGEQLGFRFKGGPDAMIWNTHDCHRLLHWAQMAGKAHALKTALFEAHFSRAEPLNDPEVLVAAAAGAGLDAGAAREVLASGRYADEVNAAQNWWRQEQDVHAVPAIIFNGKYAIMGGQPPATFEKVIRRIVAGEV
ncbi:disulfide bond formation protein DsbA [Sandarakinorhabdus cyanobacteriorum]|uniref:Disulfide bond formation protein DsbA n=1 Tax=Sandarakinorhabdus cyanobacteriorum TaxID=1981098 RepID=A0A255Z784_9SPHN|nr:DsbA family oxidoreductase [Sandarakinorhabdus cyanobacteriorum]OYQ36755.1 disulfide bond formation protein DsbA [Sandarakinorhabdus cyanobacteriorum]